MTALGCVFPILPQAEKHFQGLLVTAVVVPA
jgi:hypothetical protein